MFLVGCPVPVPVTGAFGLPGALGRMPRLPCDPTTCVGASSFCKNAGDCPICGLPKLGNPPIVVVTPPGGIGRIVGSPLDDVAEGNEVAVDDGYIIEDVIP